MHDVALHTVSLCTGLGGIERGLELAAPRAFKPVLYCEREISAAAVIAKEIERGSLPAAPIWSDVKTITRGSAARYLDRVGVDCITGGYPCQPFSVAGKRLGEDDPRHLWPFIAQAIERYAPTLCFFENVSGHLVLGFREVCECLERLGYRVAAGLFTASEIGAGHRRERLFILADSSSQRPQRIEFEQGSNERGTGRSSGADVGDCTEQGPQGATGRRFQSKQPLPPSFPPGPSGDWRAILERFPELAPALADSSGKRRQQVARSSHGDETQDARRSSQADHEPQRDHEAVDNAYSTQRHEHREQHQPVGYGNEECWGDTVRPDSPEEAEPVIRGVADGLSRTDQLRAYGNAVVPHCAAVAFISLWAALKGGGDDE